MRQDVELAEKAETTSSLGCFGWQPNPWHQLTSIDITLGHHNITQCHCVWCQCCWFGWQPNPWHDILMDFGSETVCAEEAAPTDASAAPEKAQRPALGAPRESQGSPLGSGNSHPQFWTHEIHFHVSFNFTIPTRTFRAIPKRTLGSSGQVNGRAPLSFLVTFGDRTCGAFSLACATYPVGWTLTIHRVPVARPKSAPLRYRRHGSKLVGSGW